MMQREIEQRFLEMHKKLRKDKFLKGEKMPVCMKAYKISL